MMQERGDSMHDLLCGLMRRPPHATATLRGSARGALRLWQTERGVLLCIAAGRLPSGDDLRLCIGGMACPLAECHGCAYFAVLLDVFCVRDILGSSAVLEQEGRTIACGCICPCGRT